MAPQWPEVGLDVEQLRTQGFAALPFREFVVKIHSRCNLACDYCYVYESADQSWREQPKTMAHEVFRRSCGMIAEHAQRFGVPQVSLVFHGGEPLMVGHRRLETYATDARRIIEPVAAVKLGMQTNAVLLDDEFLRICDALDIRLGVSIDGDRIAHDRHRKDRRGVGSHARVVAGLERLTAAPRRLFSGLLCTVDVANDPVETYEALLAFSPPVIDFLLPHGNWTAPPPRLPLDGSATPYADWLISIFDRWYHAPVVETHIRLFDSVLELLLGGLGGCESVGLAPMQLAVFETDGRLEQVDELKSAYHGAARMVLSYKGNLLDEAVDLPAVVARQIGIEALSEACRGCPVHTVCGGGHYVHRYHPGTGFLNPSVYCADLLKLITHIAASVRADLESA
ncbi:FxsB family cyclophane-forming radical SAM/SPASM peptide maturase [Nocardia sp. CY41]|uniref:FxsB family cyclophane-forming radical SAM/SPASM peptide maturase n=1 Tax=Nocardia sp. CY41 TaxID=2608686 RepID=UPI001358CED2|nr:FxsB family cyclophane-forming radical SAM/SPASM peptide maturase [Nocardia sp. CY41]